MKRKHVQTSVTPPDRPPDYVTLTHIRDTAKQARTLTNSGYFNRLYEKNSEITQQFQQFEKKWSKVLQNHHARCIIPSRHQGRKQ